MLSECGRAKSVRRAFASPCLAWRDKERQLSFGEGEGEGVDGGGTGLELCGADEQSVGSAEQSRAEQTG